MGYQTRYSGGGLSALQSGAGRTFVAGYYYTGMLQTVDTTATLTKDLEFAVRFEVGSATTFDRIGLEITAGVASAVVRLGIRYDSGAGLPGALLLDAGTITATGAAYGEITISQTLTPGRWWLTAAGQVAGNVTNRARTLDPFLPQSGTATRNSSSVYQLGVTGALPATFTLAGDSSNGPKIMLRAA